MYRSFGKCKNFDPLYLFKKDDCRNCSHQNPLGTNEFKVGDWCKNYTTRREIKKSIIEKDQPKLITIKDFHARRT
jgi:hypothetical protein